MKTSRQELLRDDKKNVIGIKVTKFDDGEKTDSFVIPVVDTRRTFGVVEQMEKAANIQKGSRYFKPSYSIMGYSYNISMKRR